MSEDKDKENVSQTVNWIIPRGRGHEIKNISVEGLGKLEKKGLKLDIKRDLSGEGIKADINEVVLENVPAPKNTSVPLKVINLPSKFDK